MYLYISQFRVLSRMHFIKSLLMAYYIVFILQIDTVTKYVCKYINIVCVCVYIYRNKYLN